MLQKRFIKHMVDAIFYLSLICFTWVLCNWAYIFFRLSIDPDNEHYSNRLGSIGIWLVFLVAILLLVLYLKLI